MEAAGEEAEMQPPVAALGGGFAQLIRQTIGASSVLAFSGIGTLVIALLLKYTIGLRLNVEDEATGIDEADRCLQELADCRRKLAGWAGQSLS